jgi:glycyl-tRNA synthetase alpha chain
VLKLPGGRRELAAYDWCLKASHAFNVLDARGAISVNQRAGMLLAIRKLACAIAAAHVGAASAPAGSEAPVA